MGNTTQIKCNSCEFSASTTALWGTYLYRLKSGKEIVIERESGWCDDCRTIVSIAMSADRLRSKIQECVKNIGRLTNQLRRVNPINPFRQKLASQKTINNFKSERKHWKVEKAALSIALKRPECLQRVNRCLVCSGNSTTRLKIPHVPASREPLDLNFKHQNCGGSLVAHPSSAYIRMRLPIRVFDLDVKLLNE